MSHSNGQLPDSALVEIPGGRLEKVAAANWLALRRDGGRELGIWISPLGPSSSYRPLKEQQRFWALYQSGRGNLAARPGQSNHGWGKAVDLAAPPTMRRVIDRFGARYGWRWGEARSEPWHVTYYGGGIAGAEELEQVDRRSLKRGDRGDDVRRVQAWLRDHGYDVEPDGVFGPATTGAVKQLYRAWGHEPHERLGDAGWSIVEGEHPWRVLTEGEREALAELFAERRVAKRHGGWGKVDASHRQRAEQRKAWLVARRKELWRVGQREGWKAHHRRERYVIIKGATT